MLPKQEPFSLVFQFSQECPFACPICLRYFDKEQKRLGPDEAKRMVDILKDRGLRRLTVSGGEPMVLGDELFDFLKYVHRKQVHNCLSTTGYKLDKARLEEMDGYVDHLLLSVRALTRRGVQKEYGDNALAHSLFETVINLLQWIKTTGIILEVSTVVDRENLESIADLGWQLLSLNPNVVWRIEDYYALDSEQGLRFEIRESEFDQLCEHIGRTFGHLFRRVHFSKSQTRVHAPDYFITQGGHLVTSNEHRHDATEYHVLKGSLPPAFAMRRPWVEYRKVCRDWGWGDLEATPTTIDT